MGAGLSYQLLRGSSGGLGGGGGGGGGGLRAVFDHEGLDFGVGRRDNILFTRWQSALLCSAETYTKLEAERAHLSWLWC